MRFEDRFIELLKTETLQINTKPMHEPNFFGSAVVAARLSQKKTRLKIISDMAEALDCSLDQLMFLFEDLPLNDNETETHFPSFRSLIEAEAAE